MLIVRRFEKMQTDESEEVARHEAEHGGPASLDYDEDEVWNSHLLTPSHTFSHILPTPSPTPPLPQGEDGDGGGGSHLNLMQRRAERKRRLVEEQRRRIAEEERERVEADTSIRKLQSELAKLLEVWNIEGRHRGDTGEV